MLTRIVPLLALLSAPSWAASPEDVLRSAWKDPRLALHDQAVEIVGEAKSMNPLTRTELRIEQGDVRNPQDRRANVRLFPRVYPEFTRGQNFQKALDHQEKTARLESLSKILVSRYEILARAALLKEKKAISSDLSALSARATKALSYAAQKDRAEIKGFLKNKSDLEKIDVKIADIERDHRHLEDELEDLGVESLASLDLSDLSSIQEMQSRFPLDDKPGKSLSTIVAEADVERSRAGFELEKAQDDAWLRHIELSVKDDKTEKVYGVGLAFNIPFGAAPDLNRAEKQANEIRDRVKLVETMKNADGLLKNAIVELRVLLQAHRTLREARPRMNENQMKKAAQAVAPQDPFLALELQRGWIESREQILDLEFRIRSLYILYLHETSKIVQDPEANLFSKSSKRVI